MIGVVFGLATDYEVFLVSRIREAHTHGASAGQAVVTGFRYGGRVVAAAIIMTSVFSGFIMQDNDFVKMIGFGLTAAVLFDAFIVRMALIPALFALLGASARWLPGWLARRPATHRHRGRQPDGPAPDARAAPGTAAPPGELTHPHTGPTPGQ